MSPSAGQARGFWPLRDLPVVFWLLATAVVALVHPALPAPRWLLIHLLLLGAVSHAILVWSRHFADALLRTDSRPGDRRAQSRRLLLLNGGALLVMAGVSLAVWPLTVAGAAAVVTAVGWHGLALAAQLRRSLGGRFRTTVRYYLTAAALLPVGAVLGTLLARGLPGPWHDRLTLAHAVVNVLGWMGLTVAGTLVTLWPTMLRTRIAEDAERSARRALPVLGAALALTVGGAVAGPQWVAGLGLAGYLGGLALLARALVATARARPPSSYPAWSVAAGLLWLAGCLLAAALAVGTAPTWAEAGERFRWLTPFLAAGFGAQVLLGALSYLVPVALGGGAGPVRAANEVLDRGGALRIAVVNAGLLLCALPVPSVVRVLCSMLVLAGLATFVPLLFLAIRTVRRTKREAEGGAVPARGTGRPAGQVTGLAATGVAAVLIAVAAGVAVDPAALADVRAMSAPSADVAATGRTTTVQVAAAGMRFAPDTVEVPVGDRLVIELVNSDPDTVHDLVLSSGPATERLSPGGSTTLDAGVIGGDVDGWCSVVGHRQMGMTLQVRAVGAATPEAAPHHGENAAGDAADDLDFATAPAGSFTPHDPVLPPLTDERVRRFTLPVAEVEREVAPGVTQRLWTFAGTAPGPVLHGRVGDVFEITLVNDGTIGHSIDFHAGALAPDGPMRTIPPGESLVYRFTAIRAGVWMYHCSTMPMSAHIANGMFGAVVIEPPDLPAVDRSYLLLQSELYLGPQGGTVDTAKLAGERPDAVVFNGYANQYDARPLAARVGERVRIWVLDAGPNRATSFHVVGGQFDTVYAEGGYLLRPGDGGSQALALAPAQGGFVELAFPEAGDYPFVSHVMVDAERGAHGLVRVSP
ncbi:multicopper oxidase domain-containing protein [Blastococcus tunisiensis]|uniref:Copper-containing nitrite reductase n=1 Tax=Blastococcus tunisiensis TaxID=1798228 RepID=A0A1I1Z968_9ACTN|nr:multicopper oxidase domain-containing protein [Blastococcus sp. DSM 46838]SFE28301.1 nitrite reductase (NO-forming) [Blastococcus sp. DSM 46838]